MKMVFQIVRQYRARNLLDLLDRHGKDIGLYGLDIREEFYTRW